MQNAEKVKVGNCEGLYIDLYNSSMLTFKKGDVVITITGSIERGIDQNVHGIINLTFLFFNSDNEVAT